MISTDHTFSAIPGAALPGQASGPVFHFGLFLLPVILLALFGLLLG